MKFTKDNYKEILSSLQLKMDTIPHSSVSEVQRSFDKLKRELISARERADEVLRSNNILRIGIVGQVKAGKSSFLNSLIFNGENVLPRAATPMTAGLTILEYDEENHFEVEFYSQAEWQTFVDKAKELENVYSDMRNQNPLIKIEDVASDMGSDYQAAKELVDNCSGKAKSCIAKDSKTQIQKFIDITDMQSVLKQYVGADGDYTPVVKSLTIRLKDDRLKDVQIVDTPGVNDPVVSREVRTREFLNRCHGVFFLSYAGRFFDSTDVDFLVNRIGANGIGSVVVIASKYDSVLQDTGIKYEDDLAGALEYCERALKRQMLNNISNSNYRGNTPVFDFSSGIGYSIYKKDESRWDSMEKHVVSQMKRFYPSFFSTMEDIKQTFYDLSQIEEIQDKYLDKIFSRNKDVVIAQKMDAYFGEMSLNLNQIVDKALREVNSFIKALEDGEKGGLKERKKKAEKVVSSLESGINKFSNEINNIINNGSTELLNRISFSEMRVSTTIEFKAFGRISTSFLKRDKTFKCSVECVDKVKTVTAISKSLEPIFAKVVDEWKKLVEQAVQTLKQKMFQIIMEKEQSDEEGVLDADKLRDIVNDVVASFENKQTFEINKMFRSAKNALNEQIQGVKDIPYAEAGRCDQAQAELKIKDKAKDIIFDANAALDIWKETVYDDLASEVKNHGKSLTEKLEVEKSKMLREVRDRINVYLENLNEQLKNIEFNKKVYDNAKVNLEEIKQMI